MCIRVQYTPRHLLNEPWDPDRQLITLPAELEEPFSLRALRFVLGELGIPQPTHGAVCWCGESVEVALSISEQRRSDEVIHLGA